ncbi:MAG: aldolase/citrate lyase family protein, partial [Intestinibacter sp.]
MKVLLKLMYITNDEDVATIADKYGVDRIFVDLEQIGKQERQGGMDTVQSKHTLDDVKKIKKCLNNSELLVRSNPIYENSKEEIDTIVKNGADVVMLPYFKTCEEVQQFIDYVGGRCRTCLLLETPEAAE